MRQFISNKNIAAPLPNLPVSLWPDRSGASAIEFAIVAPLFTMILVAIMAYGMYFSAALSVHQLAADAARASVAGMSSTERTAIAQSHAIQHASNYSLLSAARLSVDARPAAGDPSEFVVAVSFDASGLPIWMFSNLLPLPPSTIVRSASIKRGGY
jgi:Flp pilus assembly protein TadG